jgi:hydroxyacyl-ACP dehydratase HTD2-like protein with hotdog domain
MPIDRKRFLGYELPPHVQDVDTWRLQFFAKAIGETDPLYTDPAAAKAAGHATLPLPPTFIFCMEQGRPDGYKLIKDMGIDISRILHGEQHFAYHRPVHAGDTLTFKTKITDIYDKKGGALEFFVRTTTVTNQRGEHVADNSGTVVVRNIG